MRIQSFLRQCLGTTIMAFPKFLLGSGTVWPSYALLILQSASTPLSGPISLFEEALMGSLPYISSIFMSPFGGVIVDKFGRRWSGIFTNVVVAVSWVFVIYGTTSPMLLIGRCLFGVSGGLLMQVAWAFAAEVSEDACRGFMSSMPSVMYALGALVSIILGWLTTYHNIAYINFGLAVANAFTMWLLPETPVYLCLIGKHEDALKSLSFYRASTTKDKAVIDEMAEIKANQDNKQKSVTLVPTEEPLTQDPEKQNLANEEFVAPAKLSPMQYFRKIIFSSVVHLTLNTQNHKNMTIKKDNNIIKCPKMISNTFNDFYASVGNTPIDGSSDNTSAAGRPAIQTSLNSMYLYPVTDKEIRNVINHLPNKISCGIDEIPSILIKACVNELTSPITKLVNQSFSECSFPEKLKIAKIKPVLKKGGKTDNPSHYRPIALLPVISKVFEKCMTNRIYSFLEKYNLLNDNQFAFRKKRSTTLAAFNYVQTIVDYLRNKHYAVGLLLDMSKAYDRVSHPILLQKLNAIGIRGKALDWMKSYLTSRQQYVEIEHLENQTRTLHNIQSNIRYIENSIPQGSVIGCILFLIYINDLPKSTEHKVVMFADDISILFQCPDNNSSSSYIQQTFNSITHWLNDHNLIINNDKSKLIQFRPRQKQPLNLNTVINNLNIEEVPDCTLLGLTLDSHLTWKKHVEKIKNKLARFVYALSVLKCSTTLECALAAYHSQAVAWLRYGLLLWGHSTDIQNVFIMQKKCIRILVNIHPPHSCRPHFKNLNLLTLPSLYILEVATFVRKNLHLFQFCQNPRRQHYIELPEPKLEIYKNGPYYRAINVYNKIPTYLKTDSNFINRLKTMLMDKCYYSIAEFMEDDTM